MAYGINSVTSYDSPAPRPLEIPGAIDELAMAVGTLEDLTAALSARLERVKSHPVNKAIGDCASKAESCDIAGAIEAQTRRIRSLIDLASDNLSRLEV